MRSKKHAIILAFFAAMFFYEGSIQVGLILTTISAFLMFKWWKHPYRRLLTQIESDARRFGMAMPSGDALRHSFLSLYSKVTTYKTRYPQLAEGYQEYMDNLWSKLVLMTRATQWKQEVDHAARLLPSPNRLDFDPMDRCLDRIKRDAENLRKAKIKATL
jgi:hypothetical protein